MIANVTHTLQIEFMKKKSNKIRTSVFAYILLAAHLCLWSSFVCGSVSQSKQGF